MDQGGESGLLDRIAHGFSKAVSFLQPKPLHARRRLHGGLNTVVWDIGDGDEAPAEEFGAAAPSLPNGFAAMTSPPPTSELEYELGAVLDISMGESYAVIPTAQLVGEEVEIFVYALNPLAQSFPFEGGNHGSSVPQRKRVGVNIAPALSSVQVG